MNLKEEYDFSHKNRIIFTITTLRDDPYKAGRCVGYYYSDITAIEAVENNSCDIYEMGYYPFCVIESVKQGIYCIDRTEFWFKWNKETGKYERIPEKPKRFENLACFGIG